MKVRLKAEAIIDLQGIADYGVAHWGIPRARDFMTSLIEAIEGLALRPNGGRPRSNLVGGLRSTRHRGYLVFFVLENFHPVVVAVLSERHDLAAIDFADRIAET